MRSGQARTGFDGVDFLVSHGFVHAEGYFAVAAPSMNGVDGGRTPPGRWRPGLTPGDEDSSRAVAAFQPCKWLKWRGTDELSHENIGVALVHFDRHALQVIAAPSYEGDVLDH